MTEQVSGIDSGPRGGASTAEALGPATGDQPGDGSPGHTDAGEARLVTAEGSFGSVLAPVGRGLPIGWWGLAWLIATEAMLFAGLLSSWFFTRASSETWPQGGIEPSGLMRPSVFTVVLLSSSLPLIWAERAIAEGRILGVRVALAVSWLMGAIFLGNQLLEYQELTYGIRDNAYASLFYTTTGLHGLHVLVGLAMSVVVQLKLATGRIGSDRHLTLKIFTLYWHFVDVVWIAVFSSLHLAEHIP